MVRKVVRIGLVVVGLGIIVLGALAARAKWVIERSYPDVPLPPIVADSSAEAVKRGEMLFHSLCAECHSGSDGRATGKHLVEVPAFLGTFWSANLAHPTKGVHQRSDGEIARVLRNGVLPDGRLSVAMTMFHRMGDEDVASVLGYIRSRPPEFEPAGEENPRTKLSPIGSMVLTFVAKVSPEAPASGVTVPPKAPTVEYGRYMAEVLDCVGCHTEGFASNKMTEPNAFAGGMEMTDPTGVPIYSRNITFDRETGIGAWSEDDLRGAVTRGVRPDGTVVRKPMPLFSRLDQTDVAALYTFLKSLPKVHHPNRPGGQPIQKATPDDPAEALFVKVGCSACHGDAGPYRDKLAGAIDKTEAEVASWILDPQATKPGSIMPSFKTALSPEQAERLAKYVKALARKRRG